MELHSIQESNEFIKTNKVAFLYVFQDNCSICHAILPKLEQLMQQYPKIPFRKVNAEKVKRIASDYQIFSAPTLILFVNGKEYFREGRFVQFQQLTATLDLLYQNQNTL